MGTVVRVKNDRLFSIDDVFETEDGEMRIKGIMFSDNPESIEFVNLLVA